MRFQNGFILGVELGYIQTMTEILLLKNNENDRIKIRCQQIIEKINLIPTEVSLNLNS